MRIRLPPPPPTTLGMSTCLTGDVEFDRSRAELMANDRSAPPQPPCGAAAATAASMQNQHIADAVNGAARRMYLEVPEGVMAKLTPFEQFTVVETLTQVANTVHRSHPRPADQPHAHQVVAGTNYFFKVQVAEAEFVWLRVFVSLFGDEPKLV